MNKTRTSSSNPELNKGLQLLQEAEQLFNDRRRFLADRLRAIDYVFGEQWNDTITLPDGRTMTEKQYILEDGRMPIVNNLLSKILRNLKGQFRVNYPDPIAYARNEENSEQEERMTSAVQASLDKNKAKELDASEFEELLISAGCGWKTQYQRWDRYDHSDVRIDQIDQTRFFYNVDARDIRMFDVSAVGELKDVDLDVVLNAFAKNKRDEKRIREMFPYIPDETYYARYPDYLKKHRNFYVPDNQNKVRIIEFWKQEHGWFDFIHDYSDGTLKRASYEFFEKLFKKMDLQIENIKDYSYEDLTDFVNRVRTNQAKSVGVDVTQKDAVPLLKLDSDRESFWKVYYITPLGHILQEMETPYEHQEHPYSFGYHPLIDGRTMSLVTSILDQQRFVNRLIQLFDKSMVKGAKDLWAIPDEYVPADMDRQTFADQFVEYNGIMYYTHIPRMPPPTPIKQNSIQVGQFEMLKIMQDYLEGISSVNDAMQGERPNSGEPASLYALRVDNATVGNKDFFEFFYSIMENRNWKVLKTIKQYYTERRFIRVAGNGMKNTVNAVYDPKDIEGIEFDVSLGHTNDTAVFRQTLDTYLMNFLNNQYITFEEFLENTSMPFADKLLQTVRSRQEELQGQMSSQGITPEMLQAIQSQGQLQPN
jgi:hypothetical protein